MSRSLHKIPSGSSGTRHIAFIAYDTKEELQGWLQEMQLAERYVCPLGKVALAFWYQV